MCPKTLVVLGDILDLGHLGFEFEFRYKYTIFHKRIILPGTAGTGT